MFLAPHLMMYIFQSLFLLQDYVLDNVSDFNNKKQFLTAKLQKQGYQYQKLSKAFSKFYCRLSELII